VSAGNKSGNDGGGERTSVARFLQAGVRALVVASLLLSMLAWPLQDSSAGQPPVSPRSSAKVEAGDILDATLSLIDNTYPGDFDSLQVKREAASAALKALGDTYSELLTERDLDPLLRATALAESPQGLGMAVVKDSTLPSFLTVTSVFEGGPAQQAGLITGDRILAIAGVKVSASTSLAALKAAVVAQGPAPRLTIQRPGLAQPVDVQMMAQPLAAQPPSLVLSFSRDLPPSGAGRGGRTPLQPARRVVYAKLADMVCGWGWGWDCLCVCACLRVRACACMCIHTHTHTHV